MRYNMSVNTDARGQALSRYAPCAPILGRRLPLRYAIRDARWHSSCVGRIRLDAAIRITTKQNSAEAGSEVPLRTRRLCLFDSYAVCRIGTVCRDGGKDSPLRSKITTQESSA